MISGLVAAQARRRRFRPRNIPTPNPSVSVSISASRTSGPAPMGVFFEAEATGYETGLPKHDLRYKWTFGTDTGTWSIPTRLYDNDKNTAYGFCTVHTFDTPGTYTVTCEVTDGTTSASNTIEITAQNFETVFSGKIAVFSLSGTFEGAPAGAEQFTSESALIDWLTPGPPPWPAAAVLFHRGETFDSLKFSSFNGLYVGAYGTGDRPIISTVNGAADFFFESAGGPYTVTDLDITGPYDSVTGNVNPTYNFGWGGMGSQPITIHNCRVRGTRIIANGLEGKPVLSELDATDWMAFGVSIAGCDQGGMVGCKISMQPDASTGEGGRQDTTPPIWTAHGPYRDSDMQRFTFRQCEMFSKAGWGPSDTGRDHQQCMRLQSEGGLGGEGMIERCLLEGGFAIVNCFANAGDKVNRPQDYIFEKNIILGTANTQSFIDVGYGRTTIRNNIMIYPNVPHENSAFSEKFIGNPASGGGSGDNNANFPIYVYNNTFVDLRDNTNAPGAGSITLSDQAADGNQRDYVITYSNNIVHQPNLDTPNEPYAPLVESPAILTPDYIGEYDDGVFDAAHATPVGTVATFKPSSGSSAINGAGAGKVALDDFEGTLRGGTAYVGAWEATG